MWCTVIDVSHQKCDIRASAYAIDSMTVIGATYNKCPMCASANSMSMVVKQAFSGEDDSDLDYDGILQLVSAVVEENDLFVANLHCTLHNSHERICLFQRLVTRMIKQMIDYAFHAYYDNVD